METVNISGTYVYRSLQNNQDVQTDFNDLEFGRGVMVITQSGAMIQGTFDMGGDYKMTLEGSVLTDDSYSYLKMTAYGIPNTATDNWVYDYFGLIVPMWPNGVAQIPTITGSVIRTVDHGSSKAGVTATFYMVLVK